MSDSTSPLSEHEFLELVKAGGDAGWKLVWERVIVPETRNRRNAELMNKFSVTDGDLMGMLYEEMIGRKKIELYRDDGSSLAGWLRKYVRGYIFKADPAPHGEFSLEATAQFDENGEQMELPSNDPGILHNENWLMTHRCFFSLWKEDPRKAYVLLLRTRFSLSAKETAEMLDISNSAAVDQIFARATQFMREAWPRFDKKGWKQ